MRDYTLPLESGGTFVPIKEEFLHYVWKYKLFDFQNLIGCNGEKIKPIQLGMHNEDSGPDFLNARLEINGLIWAGTVEMHLKSSDWYAHHHEVDDNYNAVILHVVWEYDVPVLRSNGDEIVTLVLKSFVHENSLKNYLALLYKKEQWILCEKDVQHISSLFLNSWLTRLYFERLETKSKQILDLLQASANDWEAVLFVLMAKCFGMKLNGQAFLNLARSFEFKVFRKQQTLTNGLEVLLFGQAGFLNSEMEDVYGKELKKEFDFIKHKYKLVPIFYGQFSFFRLRPANFPTIRISQLAQIYQQHQNLFSKIQSLNAITDYYELFDLKTSSYWETHYTFGKISSKKSKKISKAFVDLLLINTIIPVMYTYQKIKGSHEFEKLEKLVQLIKPEKNTIISNFNKLEIVAKNAMDSQALIQLKNEYCKPKKCLHCAIGLQLLKK
ncbi:DUF2851 family protein [Flavicella sediminum]|uniref:DUF2851 family protein n=1 Tax=Flavicella sediminum TaxID=2585141 RepID=UPI001FB5A284|nr:DUF2851 family protein [Flavicella sediminum]